MGVVCGALTMVTFVGVCGRIGTRDAASSYAYFPCCDSCVGEFFRLPAPEERGGVNARLDPTFAVTLLVKAGDGCLELFISGVAARKRVLLGVGAGRREDVSDSRSLALFP